MTTAYSCGIKLPMPKEISLDSRFEDIYENRKAFPEVYKKVEELVSEEAGLEKRQDNVEILMSLAIEAAVTKAVEDFIGLGYHKYLYPKLTSEKAEGKYRAAFTLPEDITIPEEYRERFPIVNVIDPRIPTAEKDKRAGVREWTDTNKFTNNVRIPRRPYITFTHDNTRYQPYTVNQAITKFASDEVGEPYTETVDLYVHQSELFRNLGRNSAGSRAGDGSVPCLSTFGACPEVNAVSPGILPQNFGAGSRGKKLIVLGS